ncbi:MAG: SPASM domain-containing protein [Helicobacter sp.]|nr:SPASM domain-containing protein [Helicobacteraceae bacterium]MDY3114333.1 SPASM domain-containing protein [Helicobacter sp.]
MGSLLRQSLEEIWLGENFRQLRIENFNKNFKRFSACESCDVRAIFKVVENDNKNIDIGVRKMFIFDKDEDR